MEVEHYQSVIVGGTFDGLHVGHKALLRKAFAVGTHVTIGLTSDAYLLTYKKKRDNKQKTKENTLIQPHTFRKTQLISWLEEEGWGGRYTIVSLDDAYGPLLRRGKPLDFNAIVVSEETKPIAKKINQLREKQGLSLLTIITIPMVQADDAIPVSSTRLRQKEIDREGRLIMPHTLRETLHTPIGDVINNDEIKRVLERDRHAVIVTVGDKTTERVVEEGIQPRLAVIDFATEREQFFWQKPLMDMLLHQRAVTTLPSGPGYISNPVLAYIYQWVSTLSQSLLIIEGEEDLLVLPLLCDAPDGVIVYYGQPGVGVVRVVVNDTIRKKAQTLLAQFLLSYII